MELIIDFFREDSINNVQDFISLFDQEKDFTENAGNYADFLFRGQCRDHPLLPKLLRIKLRGEMNKIECLIIDEFRRASLPLAEFQPSDDWDLLALAQHHGFSNGSAFDTYYLKQIKKYPELL